MSLRRRLAYLSASLIAAAGMMAGHALAGAARAAGEESQLAPALGLLSWVAAGIAAVLIDRTVPPRAVGFASLALPLVWFGMLLVSEDNSLWLLGLAALAVFALIAAASAAMTKAVIRVAGQRRV
ncbi:MAG TPA: hypothetical protein VMN81_09010 [Vicinamibacterales bacterium]|nr:hypothetical protein [Vicinamibacterales bacterium]